MPYFKSFGKAFDNASDYVQKGIRKALNSDTYKNAEMREYIITSRIGNGSSNVGDDIGLQFNLTPFKYTHGLEEIDRYYFKRVVKPNSAMRKKITQLCVKEKAYKFTDHSANMYRRNNNIDIQKDYLSRASKDFNKGMFTTLTVSEAIPCGKDSFYIVYYTFNAKKLIDIKTLVKSGNSFKLIKLPKL